MLDQIPNKKYQESLPQKQSVLNFACTVYVYEYIPVKIFM